MPLYNASGAVRVRVATGTTFCGAYHPDGALWVTEAQGTSWTGRTAPDGSMYVTLAVGAVRGRYAPNGSVYVSQNPNVDGATYIEIVSGSLAGFIDGATLDMNFAKNLYLGAAPSNLTVSRASVGYAESTAGVWTSFASGVARITDKGLLVEEARTNSIRNNSMQGAAAGTPGTPPTNWFTPGITNGVSSQIIGTGVENGIEYVDIRYFGTNSAGAILYIPVAFETNTGVAATVGQTWTASAFLRIVGGTTAGLLPGQETFIYHNERDSGGTFLANASVNAPINSTAFQRAVISRALTQATVAFLQPQITLNVATAGTVDITIRIGWPQLELGGFVTSPIRTTTAAVARPSEQVSLTGANFTSWYTNAAAGTTYAEANSAGSASNAFLSDINDGTTANGIGSYFSVNGTFITHLVNQGGVTQAAPLASGLTAGRTLKTSMAYAANDMQAAYDSTLMTVDTSATVPTVNRLHLGRRGDNTFYLNGYIRRFAYIPSRLSNNALELLTTPDPTLSMDFTTGTYVGATPANFTFSRASDGYAEDVNGVWSVFASGVPRITNKGLLVEESRTNSLRNNSMQGAVAGTPGTQPTNWGSGTNGNGAAWSIVGTGVENGIDYVDLRLSGTVTVANEAFFFMETTTGIPASNGQTWTESFYARVISESAGSLSSFSGGISSRIAAGAAGSWQVRSANQLAAARAATSLSQNRITVTGTVSDASAAYVWPLLYIVPSLGVFDAVIRIGWPQIELGASATSPIRTTSAAVARAQDQIDISGSAFTSWYTSTTAGTLYTEASTQGYTLDSTFPLIASFDDGTFNNSIAFVQGASTRGLCVSIRSGGVAPSGVTDVGVDFTPNVFAKVAGAYSGTTTASSANGVTAAGTTIAGVPTVTAFRFGQSNGGGGYFSYLNGYIREFRYYPVRLSNNVIQSITT